MPKHSARSAFLERSSALFNSSSGKASFQSSITSFNRPLHYEKVRVMRGRGSEGKVYTSQMLPVYLKPIVDSSLVPMYSFEHFSHFSMNTLPCSSETAERGRPDLKCKIGGQRARGAGGRPDLRWRLSTFCVTTCCKNPSLYNATSAISCYIICIIV